MTASGRGGVAGALLVAVLAAAAALLVSRDDSDSRRLVVPAMESDQAAALAAQSGVTLRDFWARAKAMGVSAAIVRPQSLDDAIRRGEILRFDRGDVERWKAAGLLSPNTTLRPDTFWTKDERLYGQLLQAVSRQGLAPTTSTVAGFHVIQVPEGGSSLELSGYDPERVAALGGLFPVYAPPSGLPARVALRWQGAAVTGQAETAATEAAELSLEPAVWPAGASRDALLRRALSRPRRLLVLSLNTSAGLDNNFADARAALRALDASGANLGVPSRPPSAPARGGAAAALALVAAWAAGVLGPLFAARGGLLVLRRARRLTEERAPVASPLAQLAAGLLSTAAFAAVSALVVHALAAQTGEPLGRQWAAAVLVGPLVIALLTLYTLDAEEWLERLRRPATYLGLLELAGLALGAALLLAPRWLLHRLGLWAPLSAIGLRAPSAWWWPWRWREMLLGVPALVQALFLINRRLECPDCSAQPARPADDPRHWFLAGLLAPIGLVTAVGQGAMPQGPALVQTLWTLLLGGALGAAGLALRLRKAHAHPKGPVVI